MPTVASDRERQTAVATRVDIVLCSIQEAQQLVEQARQALSSFAGMDPERESLACLSSHLTWAWLAVAATATRRRRRSSPAPPEL